MKRLLIVLLMLMLVPVATATPTAELATLARAFPSDTLIFAAVRTDGAFIDTMDELTLQVGGVVPDVPTGVSFRTLLDLGVQDIGLSGGFEDNFGPWLGNSIALGFVVDPDLINEPMNFCCEITDFQFAIALEVTDRAAAASFITDTFLPAIDNELTNTIETAGYTVYVTDTDASIALASDHMLVAETYVIDEILADSSALSDATGFADVTGLLPVGDYNAVVFANVPGAIEAYTPVTTSEDSYYAEQATETIAVLEATGSAAAGATIIDGRALTIDIVQMPSTAESPLTLGVPNLGVVDLGFTSRIPTGTPLVIHSTNLRGLYDFAVAAAQGAEEIAGAGGTVDGALGQSDAVVNAFSGLTIDDITSWMVNDYALTLGLSDTAAAATNAFGFLAGNPVEFSIVVDATADVAAAAAVVDAIETALASPQVADIAGQFATITRDGGSLNISIADPDGQLPFPIDLVIGSNDAVFVIGTTASAQTALAGSGGLGPAFDDAAATLLPNPGAVYFADVSPLAGPIGVGMQMADPEVAPVVTDVLGLFSHATISTTVDSSGNSFARAVLSLAASAEK